jgi:dihydroxyacetone kinase
MTHLLNRAPEFAREMIAGLGAVETDRLSVVADGVVRASESPHGQVAVVMGGGSGHYPAFAGWVGPGFGHGAACGNVFASPSESQILAVARASDNGGGILFAPINYAGDILHFGAAAETLRAEGIDVRMVPITDDIASAPVADRQLRRGIAGSFIVLKIVGAAAESGATLAEVERIAIEANEATRSFGVAFAGCTLPGATGPLFTLPGGRMAVGLGIHGEPGIRETQLGTADDVADLLIDGLLAERPLESGSSVAVLVNGLGATSSDELFLVFRRLSARLEDVGARMVAPVVDSQVTSLDMAGVSVSLCVLDDERERLWLAPASTASFSRGAVTQAGARRMIAENTRDDAIPPASAESRAAARWTVARFRAVADAIAAREQELAAMDAVAGDGDHGAGMVLGIEAAHDAARRAVARGAGVGTTLRAAGAAWSDRAGGTSGALWGTGLVAAGEAVGDDEVADGALIVAAVEAFARTIRSRGGAELGDKTMVDAIEAVGSGRDTRRGGMARCRGGRDGGCRGDRGPRAPTRTRARAR